MATEVSISKKDMEALEKAIREAPKDRAFATDDFCRLWSQVKPILQTLQPVVVLIPVVGGLISAAIGTLLGLGNTAYGALCGR